MLWCTRRFVDAYKKACGFLQYVSYIILVASGYEQIGLDQIIVILFPNRIR